MDKSELISIISEIDNPNVERIDAETVMDAYHRLDDLGEYNLVELIDNYILGKLDSRRTEIFERHLHTCEKCKKEVAIMGTFIKGVKEIGDDLQ